MMTSLLVIDTALSGISVGVQVGDKFAGRQIETARGQAALLVPTIQEILEEINCDFKALEGIACTVGPGSFTGLRIGLSTAKSFALALDIPTIPMGTMDVMARHYGSDESLLVILETKRQDFYAQYFKDGVAVGKAMVVSAGAILDAAPFDGFKVGGDCLERFKRESSIELNLLENIRQPDPKVMIDYALTLKQGALNPVYLRGADVSQSKTKQRTLAKI